MIIKYPRSKKGLLNKNIKIRVMSMKCIYIYSHHFSLTWVWSMCVWRLSRGHQQALFFCILELWFQSCLATVTVTAETALILLFKPLQLGDVRSGTMVTTTVRLKQVFTLARVKKKKPWRLSLNIQALVNNMPFQNQRKITSVITTCQQP